jgi:hypothetical protein
MKQIKNTMLELTFYLKNELLLENSKNKKTLN